MITLQPVAMRVPTEECVYAPSQIRTAKTITDEEFRLRYEPYSVEMLVSLNPDGYSEPLRLTAYGYGLDCWYIIPGDRLEWLTDEDSASLAAILNL